MSWRLERGATVGAEGKVTFSVWAPRAESLERSVAGPRREDPRRAAHGTGASAGCSRPGPMSGRRPWAATTCSCFPTGRRGRIRCPANCRPACTAPRASSIRRRIAGATQRWKGLPLEDLILYELHVGTFTPAGTFAGHRGEAVLPSRSRGDRHRADAGQHLPGRAKLGIRRRGAVRAARGLRRSGRASSPGRRLPRAWVGAVPGRRLQPPGPRRELPGRVRSVLHRPLSHALGRRR